MIGSAGPMMTQAAVKMVTSAITPMSWSTVVGSPARCRSGAYSTH